MTVHREPKEILNKVRIGNFGVEMFGGQTLVYIPRAIFQRVGPNFVFEIADESFGKYLMKDFWRASRDIAEFEHSYNIELPPILKRRGDNCEIDSERELMLLDFQRGLLVKYGEILANK